MAHNPTEQNSLSIAKQSATSHMEQLDEILNHRTAAIDGEYFLLPIHGADPVHRERVYCYELYHQMRLRWPATHYRLNGEIDKGDHPYLWPWRSKPDGSLAGLRPFSISA